MIEKDNTKTPHRAQYLRVFDSQTPVTKIQMNEIVTI